MAVQTKILKRTEVFDLTDDGQKKLVSGTGVLIGGTPGQIYDVAYGPVVHTTTLAEPAKIGSFVAGHGIIINSPEYALYGTLRDAEGNGGPLTPSLLLPAGTVVSCMTAGHVWMTRKAFADMGEAMNAAIIWQQPYDPGSDSDDEATEKAHENDLIVVEVNGMNAYGPGSDDQG